MIESNNYHLHVTTEVKKHSDKKVDEVSNPKCLPLKKLLGHAHAFLEL